MTRFKLFGAALLALCVTLAGCSARTYVSATGSTPSQFTHVFITAQAVWFNTNSNAGPDDSGWSRFQLKNPVTFDLVTDSNGTLGEVAEDLRVAPGTYNTILILPVDPSTPTTTSATAAGATYNQEADFVDATGTTHQLPLFIPNVEKGIVVPGSGLTVPIGGSGSGAGLAVLGGGGATNSANTTNSAQTLFSSPTTINPTTSSSTTGTNGQNKTTDVSFGTSFDANRDLHLFTYGTSSGTCTSNDLTSCTATGVVLSPSPTAYPLRSAGGITGTLTLTSLTNITAVSDRVAIQASAETLSADGTHHVIVASAPVQTDGTFTIYPLPTNSSNNAIYDVVIHGPNIATIIIKSVSVPPSSPTMTNAATTNGGSTDTVTDSSAVSIGTFIPRAANGYLVSVTPSTTAGLPSGAAIAFYQTLPASGEAPYTIDEVGIDPFNLNLPIPEGLSAATIDTGTYTSSGTTITITSTAPKEKTGNYQAAAIAPMFSDGISTGASTTVTAPSGTSTTTTSGTSGAGATSGGTTNTTPVAITVPTPTPTSGGSTISLTATINETSGGAYNQGELIVSHNGAIVGAASLNSALTTGSNVVVGGLPGGSSATYYLSAIVWNSSTPSALTYQSASTPVNLAGGSANNVSVTLN